MPNEKELFDVDVEEEQAEEPEEETEEEEVSTEEEDDGDIEFDDDGNVIIPDDEEEDESDESSANKSEASEESEPDEKFATLEKQYRDLQAQVQDTLKRLGVKETDAKRGLAKLAADEEGLSVDDYLRKRASEQESEEALRIVKAQRFQQMAARDLAEIKAAFAGLDDVKAIQDIPNFKRFGELRDKGLTAKEAYVAANPDRIRTQAAESAKKKTLEESKAHLKSAVPKGSKDTGAKMTRAELAAWRDMFPGKSDKEIVRLFRDTL